MDPRSYSSTIQVVDDPHFHFRKSPHHTWCQHNADLELQKHIYIYNYKLYILYVHYIIIYIYIYTYKHIYIYVHSINICGKITLSWKEEKCLTACLPWSLQRSGDGSADCRDGLAFHFVGTSFRYIWSTNIAMENGHRNSGFTHRNSEYTVYTVPSGSLW